LLCAIPQATGSLDENGISSNERLTDSVQNFADQLFFYAEALRDKRILTGK
jgi:hypothetical protein